MSPIIISIISLSILSAIFYRMGGSGHYSRWVRPLGCSLCLIAALLILEQFHWILILCFGLQYGAATTYFKRKGTDAKWWNWALVGFAASMAIIPIIYFSHDWQSFFIRTFILTGGTVLWSQFIGNAVVEELGRGALIILSLLTFLIPKRKDK